MLLWYPKLSHFMKNYSSPCWQLFLLFLTLSSTVMFVSCWPLIKYSGVWPQSVSPWELPSLYRCRKSRTSNSLRNCQLFSVRVSKAPVPGVYWWLMPGGEVAATDQEFTASLALSARLSRGQVLFLTSRLLTPRSCTCFWLCKSKTWLPKTMIFVPVWLFPFQDQNSVVPFGLGSKLVEDCKPMSSYYKVNFPNYIDKK